MTRTRPPFHGIRSIALALGLSLALAAPVVLLAAQGGDVQAGEALSQKECARCHGKEGKGDGPAGKILKVKPADWSSKEIMSKVTDEELTKAIKEGGKGVGKSTLMPSFGDKLSDAQVGQLVAYIRSLQQ